MLSPTIIEYLAADRTDEARRHAGNARLARRVRTEARATADGAIAGTPSRWRAWGWTLTPRAFGSARLLPR
jgi:hypothetical protein